MALTHDEIGVVAGRWLRSRHRCKVVLVNLRTQQTREQPDAIGWPPKGWSVLVEVKVARSDFLADRKKRHRGANEGMGQERWMVTPPGLVMLEEVPPGWGLAECRGKGAYKIYIIKMAERSRLNRTRTRKAPRLAKIAAKEQPYLVGALNKIACGYDHKLYEAMGIDYGTED